MQLPYLELPLCIGYGVQADENTPDKVVTVKLLPQNISAYHEGYYAEVGTFVYYGTHVFQLALSVEELEAKIIGYWNLMQGKQNLRNKLGVVN
jgi:hypothetical protein